MRMMDNVEDVMLSIFLAVITKAAYVRVIEACKKMIKPEGVFATTLNVSRDAPAAKSGGIMEHSDPNLYFPPQENNFLMIQTADGSTKIYKKAVLFLANTFYRYARVVLDEAHVLCMERSK